MLALPRHNCIPAIRKATAAGIQSFRQFASLASTESVPNVGEEAVKDFRVENIASNLGIKTEDVLQSVKTSPQLLASPPSLWQRCFTELKAQGFPANEHLKMVTLNPALMQMVERQELSNVIDMWRNCKIGDQDTLNVLASCPNFLLVKERELQIRIPVLKSLTKSNSKHLMRLLLGNPNVMFDNWNTVLAKIDYVQNVMDIDTSKQTIAKTYLFNKDLLELKIRYMFLKRAGIYTNPPKVFKGTKVEELQQPWSKNPHLCEIIDTNEEVFVRKVAKGLCLEEFRVFQELYKKELEDEESDLEWDEDDISDGE